MFQLIFTDRHALLTSFDAKKQTILVIGNVIKRLEHPTMMFHPLRVQITKNGLLV